MVVRISDVPAPGSRERAPAHWGKYECGLDRAEECARPVLQCARVAPARLHTRGGALLSSLRERLEAVVDQLVGKGSRLRVPSGCSGPHKGPAARRSSHDGREPALGEIVWRIRELVRVDQGGGDHRVRRRGAVVRVLALAQRAQRDAVRHAGAARGRRVRQRGHVRELCVGAVEESQDARRQWCVRRA